jgi:hypothetical protein
MHQLISIYLDMTTVAHANLEAIAYTHVYAPNVLAPNNSNSPLVNERLDGIDKLNNLASSLAVVFTSVNGSLEGVPLTLSNSSFNAAKSMIMGSFATEDDEEDITSLSLETIDISDIPR